MKNRDVRYQGAIIRDDQILLIRHREHESERSYWLLPGGGIEPDETEEDCVRREIKEETNLDVSVISLLVEEPDPTGVYRFWKTFLCEPGTTDASPGSEPEPEVASQYSIVEVKWFDLRTETKWPDELVSNSYTYGHLQWIRMKMDYQP